MFLKNIIGYKCLCLEKDTIQTHLLSCSLDLYLFDKTKSRR